MNWRGVAIGMVLMAGMLAACTPAHAQGFVSKGKDGATVYSNRPPDTAPNLPMQVVNPAGADVAQYALNGATLEEVQLEAAAKAPLDPASGKRNWSATTWNAAWNYWTRQEADSCRIDVVSVRLKIATQLPAWSPPKDAPALDQCRWEAFSKSLRQREEARAAQVLKRGRELERAILQLPPRPRCDSFAGEVNALGKTFTDEAKPRAGAAPALPAAPPVAQPPGSITPGRMAGTAATSRPAPKMPFKAAPPSAPKPLAIPKSIYDACKA